MKTDGLDIYHIILHCDFTNKIWNEMESILKEIHPIQVTIQERIFGIVQRKQETSISLRNWLTYLLREFISKEERIAYHSSKKPCLQNFKQKFNSTVHHEVNLKLWRYKNENNISLFEIITHKNTLCRKKDNEDFEIRNMFA